MSNNENKSITPLRKYIAIGYAVIALLIGGIVFIYLHEWRELERIEAESKEMNMLRQKVHDAYAQMLDLTLYGEKVLEWNAEDTLVYRGKRLAMDSILCEFKQYYRPERLDSLCRLLSDKELQLFNIWNLYTRQEALNERIATEVPIIAHKSTQDPPKKRGGFLGLFKKKEKPQTTTSTMLYTLNHDLVRQQQEQSRELSEYADSLAQQNTLLNIRLQEIIHKLDTRVQVEKARAFDPFGHAGLTPLGEIRMTLAGEIEMTPVEASAGEFFVALRLLVLARRGSISKTTEYDCKIKKHPSMLHSRNGNKRDGQYVSPFPQYRTQVRPAVHFKRQDYRTAA